MVKKFSDCVSEAVRGGHITQDEGKQALDWYNSIRSQGADDAKAKSEVARQLELEARERERRSLLTAGRISEIQSELTSFRNAAGEVDVPRAWQMLHDRRGDEGTFTGAQDGRFGLSVKEMEDAILSETVSDLEAVTHEFRRGAITGDLKRSSKALASVLPGAAKTQARMSEVVKALRGEKTSDPYAQQLADAMMQVAERIRLRFNEAGGAIGKLEGWGGPQSHNQDAVFRVGRERWIEGILPRLDREKMVHTLTGRKLSDAELRESLEVVWLRIVTDGFIDEEKISGVPVGRGALWSQHADHRFLHFKSADDWMAYARDYGNTDPYVSFMNWTKIMARDIAAMEKFGPNPTTSRTYMKQWVKAQAMKAKPVDLLIKEARARKAALKPRLEMDNPEYLALSKEYDDLLTAIDEAHQHPAWSTGGLVTTALGMRGRADEIMAQWRAHLHDLQTKLKEVGDKRFNTPEKIENLEAHREWESIVDDTLQSIRFAETDNPVGYAANVLQKVDAIWEFERGSLSTPINQKTSNVMATLRNVVTSTALHSAILSAITDTAFQSVRRGFVGMSRAKSAPVTALVETLKVIGTENRREAVRSGLILDSALHAWQQEARNATRWAKARSVTGYVADRVMSLQGLNAWTQGGKHAFGLELMGHVADEASKAWDALTPQVREMLERGGFDAKGWDTIRGAQIYEPKAGAAFLRPNEIRDVDPDLAQRYIAMILRETRYAIIEPTPTAKAIMLGGTRPGTVAGEMVRGAGQLKTFPITVMMMHGGQTASLIAAGDNAGGARYMAALLITGTMMGALAMTLKDINAGRDPRKWLEEETYLDPNYWGAALLQSGGLGLYGDFLASNVNRFGGGWGQSIAGPLVQRAETLWNLTGGNAFDLANNGIRVMRGEQMKNTRFAREFTNFLRQNVPNVVWTKLLTERIIWDQMQKLIDPEAQQAFQRQVVNRKRDYGQDFWWSPGDSQPTRGPDFGRVFATKK